MGRYPRRTSSTSIYHIILRGINKQIIFEDENDYFTFIDALIHYKKDCQYDIISYCLMNNHVHLLMKFNSESISVTMKKIIDWYVWRYNRKYDRCGHLLQDRFKSEPVEDNRYLMTVARYIIQNPLDAGMNCKCNYKWSSFSDYKNGTNNVTDIELVSGLFDNHKDMMEFLLRTNNDVCMEHFSFRNNDNAALEALKKISGCKSVAEFQKLPEFNKENTLKTCYRVGMSISQLSRLTGISRKMLDRITGSKEKYDNVLVE